MRLSLRQQITRNLLNIPGWSTKRKILVIESDDWGSIRMPSRVVYNQLLKEGYRPDKDPYLRYDSLANESDLSKLFEILFSIKDIHGNPAIITANTIMANPDFEKIRNSGFEQYYYEVFTETLKRYPHHTNSFNLWKVGIENKIFHPQFHGREHLNVAQWMKGLREKDKNLHKAFDNNMISISSQPSPMRFGYMESLDYFSEEERIAKDQIIIEGLNIFENMFGFRSKSFIATCYIWPSSIEGLLKKNGIKYIQGVVHQLEPLLINQKHVFQKKWHFQGFRNNHNQRYLIRNASFEPSSNANFNWIDDTLNRISIAFRWHKPAILSIHRLNFIGSIDEKNRDRNLNLFKTLLTSIRKKFPDIEFMTSEQLGDLITKTQ